ncbi:MspA family porin [Gordonia sp. PDNC005]|uniref:MspA family porin n=1 Tax=unclassified Gordonia (in: high G+C Gram-positive bacteria) TaxID=2657482 RepID=UPI001962A808|nr:MspA family porin [Gordonia sp. PDNC005]QRY63328.1 MspA family porin [Gordonia sp. PDNC005]
MKKNSRILAVAGVVGAAAMAFTGVAAGHADAGKLPGSFKHKNLGDGNGVTIRLYDESVRVARAVTNIPTSREAWVTGKIAVSTTGDIKGATLTAGYLVGCQLNFGASAGAGTGDIAEATPSGDPSVDGSFTLGPGEAGFFPIIKASVDDEDVNSISFENGRGGLAYSQERFGVDGCAGHASARALVKVQVSTDTFKGNITAYGKPFSLG